MRRSPNFGGPRQAFGEVDPLCWGSQWRRRRRKLDDDVPIQGVHFPLDAAVRVVRVVLFVTGVIVLKRVPLVVGVQAVLLDQGLEGETEDRASTLTR